MNEIRTLYWVDWEGTVRCAPCEELSPACTRRADQDRERADHSQLVVEHVRRQLVLEEGENPPALPIVPPDAVPW